MMTLIKMAYRDLGRNRRRSFFSSLALGLGTALLLLMAAVITGEMRGAMDTSIRLQSGHIQVHAKTYDENKNSLKWEDLVENPTDLSTKIAALSAVDTATPRLMASGILTVEDESVGVSVMGIDPVSSANDPYRKGLLEGDFLTADDREGILIGQSLADDLHLKVGDTVSLMVNTSNGSIDQQNFIIRGIYTTNTPTFDKSTVFMPLSKAQAIAQAENHASLIFVLLKNQDDTDTVVNALQTDKYQIETWKTMNKIIFETESFSRAYMMMLYLIVLAITATVIVNTLVMAVFERTREIGILSAIGMKSTHIMAMFFAESCFLAIGGILIGLILGGLAVAYATKFGFYIGDIGLTGVLFGDRIYAYLTLSDTVSLSITAFVVTLVASIYPAFLAAVMEPVQALHGGKTQ